jgi:hypothetical protein
MVISPMNTPAALKLARTLVTLRSHVTTLTPPYLKNALFFDSWEANTLIFESDAAAAVSQGTYGHVRAPSNESCLVFSFLVLITNSSLSTQKTR